ncbi:MAG: MFS transporter, partial [Candidatus Obscuribacterales bacterium]|nr:MFS transporter [Candidatus Obscuribacterales bacterium]
MNTPNAESSGKPLSRLLLFFGLAYFCQHFGQAGLINQPLTYYFKEVLHYGADQIAAFFAIMTMPWVIKPLYGLISDSLPLGGYRRKSYLLLLNLAAALGFMSICGFGDTATIRMALLLTSFCTAFSDVAIDGLMVEFGKKTGKTAQFQSMQWVWFNGAMILSSLAGGLFTQFLPAESAFKVAAAVTAAFPLAVVVATWFLVKEEKSKIELGFIKESSLAFAAAIRARSPRQFARVSFDLLGKGWTGFKGILKLKTLWIVAGFIAFWQFSPSFGTPFYVHMTDNLKFSQGFIGTLNAISSVAAVIGALVFNRYLAERYSTKTLLYWSAVLGVIGTLAYILMIDPATTGNAVTAILLNGIFGITAQISILTILNLAAQSC